MFLEWLTAGNMDHEPTGALLGGPYGCCWGVIQVVRYYYTFLELRVHAAPPFRNPTIPPVDELRIGIVACLDHLETRFDESMSILRQLCAMTDIGPSDLQRPVLHTRFNRFVPVQPTVRSSSPSESHIQLNKLLERVRC